VRATRRVVDEFSGDSRGQANLGTFGDRDGGSSGGSDSFDVDMDALEEDLTRMYRRDQFGDARSPSERGRQRVRESQETMDPPEPRTVTRRDGRTVTRREGRSVSRGVDRSRSGPTPAETRAWSGSSSQSDTGLSPREQQLAASLRRNTPGDDLRQVADLERDLAASARRAAEDVYTPTGLRVNEVTAAGTVGLGTGVDAVSDSLGRQDAAAVSALGLEDDVGLFGDAGTLDAGVDGLGVFGDARSGTDAATDVFSGTDVFGRTDVDSVTGTTTTPRSRTRTETTPLGVLEGFFDPDPTFDPDYTPDPEFDPEPDRPFYPDPDTPLTPDPEPPLTPDPEPPTRRNSPSLFSDEAFGFDANEDLFSSGIQSGEELLEDFKL
jgi:hypothetical protein